MCVCGGEGGRALVLLAYAQTLLLQWQRKAKGSLKQEFEASLAQLTHAVIVGDQDPAWELRNGALIERCLAILGELQSNTNINLAMLSVAVREIAKLKTSST